MPTIPIEQDAFGRALLDHLEGREVKQLILEADDGTSTPAMEPAWFFQTSDEWYPWEKKALETLKGPGLDLGCGAGRASLYLQEKGLEVTALDKSPNAVEVCRRRGIRDVRLGDLRNPPLDERWRSILMLCGNLGLAGGWKESRQLLSRLANISTEDAVLIGDTIDPTITDDPEEIEYQRRQIEAGRYIGQVRLRLRYGEVLSLWWEQSNFAIRDIPSLVEGTGWSIQEHHVNNVDHYLFLRKQSRCPWKTFIFGSALRMI